MNTEFSEVYDMFETKMQNHPDYFEVGIGNQLTDKEIVKIINKKNLMMIKQALPVLQRMVNKNQPVDFLNCDYDSEEFNFELHYDEIELVAECMRLQVLENEGVKLAETKLYVKGDIKTYSPNEGRKTYMNDFLAEYRASFEGKVNSYNLINRETGEYLYGY